MNIQFFHHSYEGGNPPHQTCTEARKFQLSLSVLSTIYSAPAKRRYIFMGIVIAGILATSSTLAYAETETSVTLNQTIPHTIPDLRQERDTTTKKRKFFDALRPMVNAENQRISEQRLVLIKLEQQDKWSVADASSINQLLKIYHLERNKKGAVPWQALGKRVDTVPLELVLSQAANESAWGTSRFARQGNNLFGQWCFSKGCGLVPQRRTLGATHEVASFPSAQASVRSYLRNINTGRAYADLRNIRAQQRQAGKRATASQLAEGLSKYSERGEKYVQEIKAMIRYNRKLMQGED
ncbi:MAG: glucosaminidase domain-containing protein [Ghiorsea sp.]